MSIIKTENGWMQLAPKEMYMPPTVAYDKRMWDHDYDPSLDVRVNKSLLLSLQNS